MHVIFFLIIVACSTFKNGATLIFNYAFFQLDVEEAGTYAEEDGSYPEEEEIINKTRKNLTNHQRRNVYNALLERSVEGKLKNNTTKEVSELLSVHIRTVQRIWKQGKDSPPGVLVDVSRKKRKGVVARKFRSIYNG